MTRIVNYKYIVDTLKISAPEANFTKISSVSTILFLLVASPLATIYHSVKVYWKNRKPKTEWYILILFFAISCNKNSSTILECGGGGEFSCPEGTFCQYEQECGGVDAKGTCDAVPTNCSQEESFVCGCNGRTYTNECMANAAKVSIDYSGACIVKNEEQTNKNEKKFDFPSTKIDIDPSAVENAGDRETEQYEDSVF